MPKTRVNKSYLCICTVCNISFFTVRKKGVKFCSIKCLHKDEYQKNMLLPKWRLKKLLAMAKNRAKEKGLPFDLDLDHLLELWEQTDGSCPISGRKFNLEQIEQYTVNPNAPSIDRIVPKLGYVKENIRIVLYSINVALSEYGLEEFINLVNDISTHRKLA